MNAETNTEHAALAAPAVENQFVTVPARTLKCGIAVAEFRVAKYMAAIGADGSVTVNADAVPTTRMSYDKGLAVLLAAGLPMLTLTQSAALAEDVASVGENWSGGEVGKGELMRGLHLGTVRGPVNGHYVSPHEAEIREFKLSNGETVFDVAGLLYTHLFDDVHGDARGLVVTESFPENSPVVCGAPAPSGEQGVGYYPDAGEDWSGRALLRGGCWSSVSLAGAFYLYYVWPDYDYYRVGFRCTKPSGL